jgi:hypothetical protein
MGVGGGGGGAELARRSAHRVTNGGEVGEKIKKETALY